MWRHRYCDSQPLIAKLLQNALPIRTADDEDAENPLAVIPDPDDVDAEDYEAPPPPPPQRPPQPHRGYQPPPRNPMVGGRRGKSGPALGSSDVRWKENIVVEGTAPSGVPLISWNYKTGHPLGLDRPDAPRYFGTAAQALLAMGGRYARAVTVGAGGWLMVDYSQLHDVPYGRVEQAR